MCVHNPILFSQGFTRQLMWSCIVSLSLAAILCDVDWDTGFLSSRGTKTYWGQGIYWVKLASQRGEGEKREGVLISKQSTQYL